MDFPCDKCQNLVSVPGDYKPSPLYCLACDPTYSHLTKNTQTGVTASQMRASEVTAKSTAEVVKSKAGFQATAEVVKSKSCPVNDPTEIGLGQPDACNLGSNIEMPKFKMEKLDGSSELLHFGLNYAIVTYNTEEIVAAFGSAALAELVCRQINNPPVAYNE